MSNTIDIAVLREMVRLAEHRREEALHMIEKVNQYNLAIIAFAGSFLSLLITVDFPKLIVQLSGISLVVSIVVSLYSIRPQKVVGGALDIADDIDALNKKELLTLTSYLLDVAELTNKAATSLHVLARAKKRTTIVAASLLAFSLIMTYTLFAYA